MTNKVACILVFRDRKNHLMGLIGLIIDMIDPTRKFLWPTAACYHD